jgi:hypothetical protein
MRCKSHVRFGGAGRGNASRDAGTAPRPDPYFHKVREGGRVLSVATVIATGVNAEGHREILGLDVFTTEDGAGWTAFLRGLVARGLSGVALVISDAHEGLKNAIAAVLPGASWQRCRTHAMRKLLTRVPKAAQAMVATLVRTIFAQSDATQVRAQFARVLEQLEGQFPAAAEFLIDAEADLLAFASFPVEHWRQTWSNNIQKRLNKELRRRHRRGRHLPQPARPHPPGRCRAGRAARRVGHRSALHRRRVAHQGPTPRALRRADRQGGERGTRSRRLINQHG